MERAAVQLMRKVVLIGMLGSLLLSASSADAEPCKAVIRIHENHPLMFNGVAVANDKDAKQMLLSYKKRNCEVHLVTDKQTGFKALGRVIVLMQEAGFDKIGFLTEPDPIK